MDTYIFKVIAPDFSIPASNYLIHFHYIPLIVLQLGHHIIFIQPMTRIDPYFYSLFPSSVKIWNNALPHHACY